MFLFSCSMGKLNCFVKKKDGNGKYHMRTVIAPLLALYIIIATPPSSRPSSRILFSLHRLVIFYASRLYVSYPLLVLVIATTASASHIPHQLHSISMSSCHEFEPDTANMGKSS